VSFERLMLRTCTTHRAGRIAPAVSV
jgi:hypothetical protein